MSVMEAANQRNVSELLHYTTSPGILGFLATSKLLSRKRLETNGDIAFIREPVWPRRKPTWDDHISLSISRINLELHAQSQQRLVDHWWGILSFSISLLDDERVWFATCNNFFPSCSRGQFVEGFESLFADQVEGKYQKAVYRKELMPESWPTDRSAEVLYPGYIPITNLNCIYVTADTDRAQVQAWVETLNLGDIDVLVDASKFT